MHGRDTDGGAVDVYAGECRIEDGTVTVRHSPLRAINPLVLLVVVLLLVLSGITAVTGWQFGRPGQHTGWGEIAAFAALVVVASLFTAYRKDVLTDQSIPVDAITGVSVTEESRGWYLKQTRTLPTVVVEYTENGQRREYPIRLTLHGDDTDRELEAVVELFEDAGFRVRDEREP